MSFSEYRSKPITRTAHEVTEDCIITECDGEASTSIITIDNKPLRFKHYETVNVGDFVVFLNTSDIYHCNREVFLERNILNL